MNKFKYILYCFSVFICTFITACNDDETIVEFPPTQAEINIEKIKSLGASKVDVFSEQWGSLFNQSYHFDSPYIVLDRTDNAIYFDMGKLIGFDKIDELNTVSLYFK